jgi:hypothetical protein
MIKPNESFEIWAKSYSGIDGGCLKRNGHWFCGIEFGGEYTDLEFEFNKGHIKLPSVSKDLIHASFLKYQFNSKLAKIYTVAMGQPLKQWMEFSKSIGFCTATSNTIKFNLYPIACKESSEHLWTENHYKRTGFPTKALYKAWCQQYRFPLFKKLRDTYKPEIIICTGATYTREFLLAFGGANHVFLKPKQSKLKSSKTSHFIQEFSLEETKLFVIPFLGRQLNSNDALNEVGELVRGALTSSRKTLQIA